MEAVTSWLNVRALLLAVGIALGAYIVLIAIGAVAIGGSLVGLLGAGGGLPTALVAGSMVGLGASVVCLCCSSLGVSVGEGAIYAVFAERFGMPLDTTRMAVGGAAAPMITAIILNVASFVFTQGAALIGNTFTLEGMVQQAMSAFGLQICLYAPLYLLLGAAGAAIYVAIRRNREQQSPPAPSM